MSGFNNRTGCLRIPGCTYLYVLVTRIPISSYVGILDTQLHLCVFRIMDSPAVPLSASRIPSCTSIGIQDTKLYLSWHPGYFPAVPVLVCRTPSFTCDVVQDISQLYLCWHPGHPNKVDHENKDVQHATAY